MFSSLWLLKKCTLLVNFLILEELNSQQYLLSPFKTLSLLYFLLLEKEVTFDALKG